MAHACGRRFPPRVRWQGLSIGTFHFLHPLCYRRSSPFVEHGGDIIAWVGFELIHKCISQRRAEWFTRWTNDIAQSEHVHMSTFEEGLGRVMYVVGALEYARVFLAPLKRFLCIDFRGSVRRVPAYVSFLLSYLSRSISLDRHYSCAVEFRPSSSSPRVDAQASDDRTGVGGWLPVLHAHLVSRSRSLKRSGHGCSRREVALPL